MQVRRHESDLFDCPTGPIVAQSPHPQCGVYGCANGPHTIAGRTVTLKLAKCAQDYAALVKDESKPASAREFPLYRARATIGETVQSETRLELPL